MLGLCECEIVERKERWSVSWCKEEGKRVGSGVVYENERCG